MMQGGELLDICRTCLSKSEQLLPLIAVIDEENFNVKDYLKKYVQFESFENDEIMPKNICLKCFDRLLEVRNYYIQCHESEKYLKLQVSSPKPIKIENIKVQLQILREKNDIDSFQNFQVLNENDLLKFENNDQDTNVESERDNVDNKNDKMAESLQDLDEFEYLCEKSEKESEDDFGSNILYHENLNIKRIRLQDPHKDTAIKCVSCYTVFDNLTEFEIHECIIKKLKDVDNFESTDNSQNKMSLTCPHQCEFCERSFGLLGRLHRHIIISHRSNILDFCDKFKLNNLSFGCINCGMKYIPKKTIRNCVYTYKRKKQQFVCPTCGKVYQNLQSFKEHEFAHQGIKPYKCDYCGKLFSHECVRRAHLKLHTGKDVVCPVCNNTFVSKSQLRIHMTYHTNDLRFPCDMCPKRFRRNHLLQLHKKTHTGRKTEECEYCHSCFYTKDDLRGHKHSVHYKLLHCNLCTNRYSEPIRLRQHMLKTHEIEIEDVSFFKKKVNEIEILNISKMNI